MKKMTAKRKLTRKETKQSKKIVQEKTAVVVPDDVVFEILVRLPARSVGRFRRVCKSWLSISTNSAFVRAHIQHSRTARQVLVIDLPPAGSGGGFFLDSHPGMNLCNLDGPTKSSITASCDGLLCFWSNAIEQYYIFNPLTGTGRSVISLTEKSHQTCFLAFYFHHSTSEYRLLAAAHDETYELVVGGNSWKHISSRLPAFCDHSYTADLNGFLHWLAWKQKPPSANRLCTAPPDIIMTFDKESEVYGLLSLQPPEKLCYRGSNLLNFKGELGLWVADNLGINLWVMEECWVIKYSINFVNLWVMEARPKHSRLLGVADSIGDEEPFNDIHVSERLRYLVHWNLQSDAYNVWNWKTSYPRLLNTFSYMESLLNPNHSFRT